MVASTVASATVLIAPKSPALLQASGVDVSVDLSLFSVVGTAVGAFLTTLALGAVMVALAPEYTRHRMAEVVDQPLGAFVYGIVSLVFIVLVTIVLVFTVIGIVVALPLLALSYVVWAIGSAIAFLAIADRLVGHEDGWARPLLVGAGINGLLTVTGAGAIVSFCIGAAGFGAVLQAYLE
ncbi:MAG: hypothetical protein ABEH35_05075 [Haloarculaceae archaeon]